MPISTSCPKCGNVIYAPKKEAGMIKNCPGCGQSLIIPTEDSNIVEKPTIKACPKCSTELHLTHQLNGQNIRCNKCDVLYVVSTDPWSLSVVNSKQKDSAGIDLPEAGHAIDKNRAKKSTTLKDIKSQPNPKLPPGMPRLPDNNTIVEKKESSALPKFWYIPGKENQPVGPFSTEQIIRALQTGKLNEKTFCWQEGMVQWLPVSQVEQFSSAITLLKNQNDEFSRSPMARINKQIAFCATGGESIRSSPTNLGILCLFALIIIIAILSSFVGTLLLGRS